MAVKTALVVEDDKGIQALLRDALEHEGFQVMCEKDGEWGLRALQRRLPDVLVTDILLPSLGGFELIEALRRMPGGEHVPVVCISGIYRASKHKKNAKDRLQVAAYIDKPFEVAQLVVALQEALGDEYPSPTKTSKAAARPKRTFTEVGDDPLADFDTKLEKHDVEKAEQSFSGPRTAKGNLKHKRFPEVLSQLYRWKSTGALLLRRERTKKIVYLKEGYPIFVKSNLLSECLGRVLVREKMISDEECERSLQLMKDRPGRQQGTVLIELGSISPHNLVFALQLQLEQKLFDIFSWPDGDYQFNGKIEIPTQTVHLDMSLATIVYEGVRRKFSESLLDDLLEPFIESFVGPHPDPAHRYQDLSLEADERRLLALIDGRRTMKDVIDKGGLSRLHAKQLVYALLATETIQPLSRAAKKRDALEDPTTPTTTALIGSATQQTQRPPPLRKRGVGDVFAGSPTAVMNAGTIPQNVGFPSGDGLPPDEARVKLMDRARAMRRQNFFEMLGVSRAASGDEIHRAYHALIREVHPDRLRGNVPADARAVAEQIAAQLEAAFDTLSDEGKRAEYKKKLEQGQKTGVSDELGKILAAEGRFRKGEVALHAGSYAKAATLFREAVDLYPEEGEFHAHLGWALYLESPDDAVVQADAMQRLHKGIQLSPRLDKAHLFLGRVLTRMGRAADAQKAFEQALVCNPDSAEALAELKLAGLPTRQRRA